MEDLVFIRKAQALGFTLDEVAEIVTLTRAGKTPCARVVSLTEKHLAALDERIARMRQFRDSLAVELARWRSLPPQAAGAPCQMIVGLAPDVARGGRVLRAGQQAAPATCADGREPMPMTRSLAVAVLALMMWSRPAPASGQT